MESQSDKLNSSEKNRNKHGPCLLYEYEPENQGTYPSSLPGSFCDIVMNHAKWVYSFLYLFVSVLLKAYFCEMVEWFWICPAVYVTIRSDQSH